MKSEYLRHEYTWSNHCITGNVLGWGITASSCPKEKAVLRELEKIASGTEPDRTDRIPVEELAYSPETGFVKMTVLPWDAGEDNRKNKKVFIFQPEKKQLAQPEIYFAPEGVWKEESNKGFIPSISLESVAEQPENIFIKMNVYDRLPDFLRAVFWCLFGKKQGINIVAPSWKKEEFAVNAKKLMYAVHSVLPPSLRKKAGYISYTEQAVSREPFYFSNAACGANVFNLDKLASDGYLLPSSKMEEYFFFHLAEFFAQKNGRYEQFLDIMEQYIKNGAGGNTLEKIEWLFYVFCKKHGKESLGKETILPRLPELFYWASKDSALEKTADEVTQMLRQDSWRQDEKEEYIRILAEGYTKKAQKTICGQLDWLMQDIFHESRKEFSDMLALLKEKNEQLYAALLTGRIEDENSWQRMLFEEHMSSFDAMEAYIKSTEKAQIPPSGKDRMIMEGIGLLNKELFKKENYAVFDGLMIRLNRKDQWIDILRDFVRQLETEAENFDDAQLDTACFVEQLLKKYAPGEAEGILMKESRKRRGLLTEEVGEEAGYVSAEDDEEEEENGRLIDLLLVDYPQGFLTGCVLYLSNYTLTIGHWKIAVGMAGMWVLLMLNHYYLMMHKEKKYAFWKNIGVCLLAGYVIEFIASLFLSQKIRLYYFIVLGVIAIGVEILNIFRKRMEKEEE